MAIATKSNFQIYHEQFFGGMNEVLTQQSNYFNSLSNGAISFVTRAMKGDWEQESFFQRIASLVTRRDITSVSSATDLAATQEEERRVKCNEKIGPVAVTRDAFRKINRRPEELSFIVGQQTAKAVQVRNLHLALVAGEAAIDGQTDLEFTRAGTMRQVDLVDGIAKQGDNSNEIVAWIMHSKVAHDLLKLAITDKVTNVYDVAIVRGTTATLGRPAIITDDPALIVAGSPTNYVTLGLHRNGIQVVESEEQEVIADDVTGLENLVVRIQGEYAVNVGVKGFKWGSTVNPTDAALGTSANWTKVAASHKGCGGVRILSQ